MATYKHIRSSTANKRPTTSLADGQLAINTNTASPGLFFKDSAGTGIVKVGPVHVGTTAPNSTPAAGGSSGNYLGEQWLDTSVSPAQMKVWNGSAWVAIVADELPVSKLQDGAAGQIIQTDSAGTGVEWSNTTNLPLGTATAPAYRFQGDTNTGIYSPGADQLALSTNGTGRLFVSSTGALAINENLGASVVPGNHAIHVASDGASLTEITHVRAGNSSGAPSYNFRKSRGTVTSPTITSVGDTVGNIFFSAHDGTGFRPTAAIQAFTDGVVSADSTPGRITFSTSPNGGVSYTERLRITSAGLVGIGTSSPTELLEIKSNTAPTFRINNGTAILGANQEIGSLEYYTNDSTVSDGINGTGIAASIVAFSENSFGVDTYLSFRTRGDQDNTANASERLRIDSQGRVGVGTTSPTETLTIAGTNQDVARIKTTAVNAKLYFEASGTTASNYIQGTGNELLVVTNGGERARIDSSGRLLVGTSSDSGGALLQVNGNRVRIATAKTPASASDTGTTGEVCWDASYIYVCTATNTWKRAALSTW